MNYKYRNRVTGIDDIEERSSLDTKSITYLEIEITDDDFTDEDIQEMKEEIREYHWHGCSCAHDCCGHWFGGVTFIAQMYPHSKRYWVAQIESQRNY